MINIGRRKRSGFTLIEIIIVVVILGILAAVAMPKLTENIDKARAAEAFNMGSTYTKAVNRCLDDETGGSVATPVTDAMMANCNQFTEIGMAAPTSTNFTYAEGGGTLAAGNILTATGVLAWGGTTSTVVFTVQEDGTVAKACTGKLAKMCKA